MRFIYDVRTTPDVSEMFSDILAVLTGETDEGELICTDIDSGGTSITANTPAGWTLYDSDTGVSDEAVIRAPCVDDAAQYKYLKFSLTIGSGYRNFVSSIMEDWNTGTNTATNECDAITTQLMRTPTATYGIQPILFQATARSIVCGATAGDYLSGAPDRLGIPVCEVPRIHPCLGTGLGRVPMVSVNPVWTTSESSTAYARIPRIIDDAGTTDLTNVSLHAFPSATPISMLTDVTPYSHFVENRITDANGQIFYGANLIQFDAKNIVANVGGTTEVANIWIMHADPTNIGPLNQSVCYMQDIGTVRCMPWRYDRHVEGNPFVLFRIEDE